MHRKKGEDGKMSRSKREEQGGKRPLWQRMRTMCDQVTHRDLQAELTGAGELKVQGCERILDYTPDCIHLAVRDGKVCEMVICGRELVCLSYHPDAILIRGRIEGIRLCFFHDRRPQA